MNGPIPATTRPITRVFAITLAVGVLVGVATGPLGVWALVLGAVYLASIALYLVPGQRQLRVTDERVEVRRTPTARPEVQVAHAGIRLGKRGPLFTWWVLGDRRYSVPTARSAPLFELVGGQP